MSSMKRQSSWQEDIAKNFSRLFSRSKSQEQGKTGTESAESLHSSDDKENEINSPNSGTKGEVASKSLFLDFSKAFQGSDEKENPAEDGAGSPTRTPAGDPPPCTPADEPPPPPPLDAFFKKLGSLFHLHPKPESQPPRGSGQQGAAEAGDAVPEPAGMTSEARQSGAGCDPRAGLLGQPACPWREGEERGQPQPPTREAAAVPPAGRTGCDSRVEQCWSVNKNIRNDPDVESNESTEDKQTSDLDSDEHRRLALSCPPSVTFGTYEGLRPTKKMKEKHPDLVDSPVPEGKEGEMLLSVSGDRNIPSAEGERGSKEGTVGTCYEGVVASPTQRSSLGLCSHGEPVPSCDQKATQGTETNSDLLRSPVPAGLGGESPVVSGSVSVHRITRSALAREEEPRPGVPGGLAPSSLPGAVAGSSAAAEVELPGEQPVAEGALRLTLSETRSGAADTSAGAAVTMTPQGTKEATERAETLSLMQPSARSRSGAGDAPPCVADGAQGIERTWPHTAALIEPAASSSYQKTLMADGFQDHISDLGWQEAEGKDSPLLPKKRAEALRPVGTDIQQHCDLRRSESEEVLGEGTGLQEAEFDRDALERESKRMVDIILRNALAALHEIEAREREGEWFSSVSEIRGAVLPAGHGDGAEGHRHAVDLHERSLIGLGDERGPSPVSAEQTLISPIAHADGDIASPSCSESFVGSGMDMRINPEFVCDHSLTDIPAEILNQSQMGTSLEKTSKPLISYPAERHEYNEGIAMDLPLNNNVKPIRPSVGTGEPCSGKTADSVLTQKGRLIESHELLLQNRSPVREHDDVTPRQCNVMTNQTELPSVKINKDKVQVPQAERDRDYDAVISTKATELINEVMCLAKATIVSDKHHGLSNSCNGEKVTMSQLDTGDLNRTIDVKNTVQLKQEQKTTMSTAHSRDRPAGKTLVNETQLARSVHPNLALTDKTFKAAEPVTPLDKAELSQSSKEKVTRNGAPDNELTVHSAAEIDFYGNGSEMKPNGLNNTCQVEQKRLQGQQAEGYADGAGDQRFLLVQSYLAAVIEDQSDCDGSDDDGKHQETRPLRVDASREGERPTCSDRQKSHASSGINPALCAGNEERRACNAVGAQHSDLPPVQCAGSISLRQGDDIKPAGLSPLDKKGHLDGLLSVGIDLPLPPLLHRPKELDCREGAFDVINEEEEVGDAVFVNGSGPALSPTLRKYKVYPFSLSPIYEEESFREDASMEDLPDQPLTEEDAGSVEQHASSILSLLQSVSERLQLGAFRDSGEEPPEEPSAPLERRLWDSHPEGESEPCQGIGEEQSIPTRRPYEMELPCSGRDMDKADSCGLLGRSATEFLSQPSKEEPENPAASSGSSAAACTPIYQYMMAARSLPSKPRSQSIQPRSTLSCFKGSGGPSPAVAAKTEAPLMNAIALKVNPRPGKLVLYDGVRFTGRRHEIQADVEDATGMVFARGVSIRVVRGCWLLYGEHGYQGPCLVLEEGEMVLNHFSGFRGMENSPSVVHIGSIKRAVKDNCIPEIELHCQEGAPVCFQKEIGSLENHGRGIGLASLAVKSGCWLAYDSINFEGNYTLLGTEGSQVQDSSRTRVTCVKSLRPLQMGGLKVQNPMDPKMVLYEQAAFRGRSRELTDHIPSVAALRDLQEVGSLRVTGGVWVAYSRENYKGSQYLLEEGDYANWHAWGGLDSTLLSFRYILADFMGPSVSLLEGPHSPHAKETDISDLDVPDLRSLGLAGGADSIHVKSGVWVAYNQRCFCGEQYVLEKGIYKNLLDWGGSDNTVMSIRPVRLEPLGSGESHSLLRAYRAPHYRGNSVEFESEVLDCSSFVPKSFRVIRGCWLLFDEEGFAGNQFVLEEGLYPDLTSCGCVANSIKSLKPIQYTFTVASISLFSRDSFEGQEMVLEKSVSSMNNFFTQSVRVNSGLWIVYEHASFKGRQMLLNYGDFDFWSDYSGWNTIGSLQPLKQPKLYIRVKNRSLGTLLTGPALVEDSSPSKVSLSPATGTDSQVWSFRQGLLKSKACKVCLAVIGGKDTAGGRVALWPEHGRAHQRWRINKNGTISSHLKPSLVLDLKGGKGYDKDHLVVNEFTADHPTQYWDIEVV
nr:PREDICTED: uncharacterized protein LOC102690526 isoform X1 [Lepisosteus oculatus]